MPDSGKFSFKELPQFLGDKNSNHSVAEEIVSTKQPSEDANLIIQNRSMSATNNILHIGMLADKNQE